MTPLVKRLKDTAAGLSVSFAIASGEGPAQAAGQTNTPAAIHVPGDRPTAKSTATYADGTYVARGWYGGRSSSITVTLTLTSDVVTAVEVRPHAIDPASLELQHRFASAVPDVVVGKRVGRVRVGRLEGSGGTSEGFNDAVQSIKEVADVRLTRARFRDA